MDSSVRAVTRQVFHPRFSSRDAACTDTSATFSYRANSAAFGTIVRHAHADDVPARAHTVANGPSILIAAHLIACGYSLLLPEAMKASSRSASATRDGCRSFMTLGRPAPQTTVHVFAP